MKLFGYLLIILMSVSVASGALAEFYSNSTTISNGLEDYHVMPGFNSSDFTYIEYRFNMTSAPMGGWRIYYDSGATPSGNYLFTEESSGNYKIKPVPNYWPEIVLTDNVTLEFHIYWNKTAATVQVYDAQTDFVWNWGGTSATSSGNDSYVIVDWQYGDWDITGWSQWVLEDEIPPEEIPITWTNITSVNLSVTSQSITTGQSINYTSTITPTNATNVTYSVTFGDSTSTTNANGSKAYANAGNYTIQVVATDSQSNSVNDSLIIEVTTASTPVTATESIQNELLFAFGAIIVLFFLIPQNGFIGGILYIAMSSIGLMGNSGEPGIFVFNIVVGFIIMLYHFE